MHRIICFQEYSEDQHTPFPEDLQLLAKYIAGALGYSDYNSEAAIVNYYHLDSTLAGHTDHSEFDLQSPLISIRYSNCGRQKGEGC